MRQKLKENPELVVLGFCLLVIWISFGNRLITFILGMFVLSGHLLSKRISESEAELRKEIENIEKKVDQILERMD